MLQHHVDFLPVTENTTCRWRRKHRHSIPPSIASDSVICDNGLPNLIVNINHLLPCASDYVILYRLAVGAVAGIIIGFVVANLAVEYYPARTVSETIVEHENRKGNFALIVFVITAGLLTLASVFAGTVRLGKHAKGIVVGALIGITICIVATYSSAYLRNEWPFRGKAPQTSLSIGRTVGVPLFGILGACFGYTLQSRIRLGKRTSEKITS